MNVVLIHKGHVVNVNSIADIEARDDYLEKECYMICLRVSTHDGDPMVCLGDDICFNHRRYKLSLDNFYEVVNQLRIHQHNSDIRDALAKLK